MDDLHYVSPKLDLSILHYTEHAQTKLEMKAAHKLRESQTP